MEYSPIPEIIILVKVLISFVEDLVENKKFDGDRNPFRIFIEAILAAGILWWGGFFEYFYVPQIIWIFTVILQFMMMDITLSVNGEFISKNLPVKVLIPLFYISLYWWGGMF